MGSAIAGARPRGLRRRSGRRGRRPDPEPFTLIDVTRLKGGLWRAVCECAEAPQPFEDERAAWVWVVEHRCPVLDPHDRVGLVADEAGRR